MFIETKNIDTTTQSTQISRTSERPLFNYLPPWRSYCVLIASLLRIALG
jgi:hypothetical protein